jgi:hypothetical protein
MLHFNYQIKKTVPNYNPTKKLVLAVNVFWCYFQKFKLFMIFKVIIKITPVSKKKLKTPRTAPMLHFNYQIKILAPNYNPKKKLVLAVKVFWCYFQFSKFFKAVFCSQYFKTILFKVF